jgi:hypothetical protein
MQLKPITAITVLLLVVASLLVSGCTTTPTVPTVTTTPTVPTVINQTTSPANAAPTSADLSATINRAFTAQNYTITTPFTRAVNQYGNMVYTGVVKDGENKLVPYVHNMTIEETKSRNETMSRFDAYVAQAQTMGYSYTSPISNRTEGFWLGSIGDGSNLNNRAAVRIAEPNHPISWFDGYISVFDANYTVVSDYTTKA